MSMLNRTTRLHNFADAGVQIQRRRCSISAAEALNFNAVCISDSEKPQYIKYPLSLRHNIWYNSHILKGPKIGAFYQKTANLRDA